MHTQGPANRLRELRDARNITLKEIGEACGGKYTSTVKRWEDTFIPQPHLGTVAELLGVSVSYLAGWTDTDDTEQAA